MSQYKDYLLGIVFYKYLSDSFLIRVYDLLNDDKPENLKDALEAYKEALADESAEELKEHSITRRYHAIVHGNLKADTGTVNAPIGRHPVDRKKMSTKAPNGRNAITHYKVLERFGNYTYIECELETGRTHQIRVHLSSIGCNLIGDDVYVKAKKSCVSLPATVKSYVNSFPRQALHAYSLGFIHPVLHKEMSFTADFPNDIKELLERLRAV